MEKSRIVGVMVLVLLVCNGGVALGVDPDYYVSPNGDDAWNGEYPTYQEDVNGPKATIQAGINVAGSGSSGSWKTIHVLNNEGQGCTYNVNSTILLDQYNYQEIIFYQDVVVEGGSWFDNDWPPKTWRAFFRVENVHHVKLTGYAGATFRLTKAPGNDTYNGSSAIWLKGCSNVEILGLTLEKSRGDGIIISHASYDSDIIGVDCDNNTQNAISVYSADDLTIDNCILRNTSGAILGPCAGIKIEPDSESCILKDIDVCNTTIKGNAGTGSVYWQLGIGLHNLDESSEAVDITFDTVTVTDGPGIGVANIYDNGPEGLITFRNVTVESTHYGAYIRKSSQLSRYKLNNNSWL